MMLMCQTSSTLFFAVGVLLSLAQSPAFAQASATTSTPFVTGGHYKLTLTGAEKILAVAKAKAEAMQLRVNIAVVDDGGHLIAFQRMDGARPASLYTAITKATASATLRAPTRPLPLEKTEPDIWLNLSLQMTAGQSGGKLTTLKGGVPIIMDGQVIGAVGVGGGSGEEDAEIAAAGIAALELKK
jgi:glc operon protein GlcG